MNEYSLELYDEISKEAVNRHRLFIMDKVTQDLDIREDLSYWLVLCAYWKGVQNEKLLNG